MDELEQARGLMRTLGAGLGLELEPDADEACAMRIDDRLDITLRFESRPPAILAYSRVGELPSVNGEAATRRLLEANHIWEATRGATWSLLEADIVLARLYPLDGLDAPTLARELAVFVEVASAGQSLLAGGDAPPEVVPRAWNMIQG